MQPSLHASTKRLSRRAFLVRVGEATATLTVVGAGLGRYLEIRGEDAYLQRIRNNWAMSGLLPNGYDPVEPAPGTRPEITPLDDHFRLDISSQAPDIDGDDWRLRIDGLVNNPLELSLDDLRSNYEPVDEYITLACISNGIGGRLIGTTRWTGVHLQDVLADAGLWDGTTQIVVRAWDGFYETVELALLEREERVLLVYDWDGEPLRPKFGFPLRLYIPDLYGMKLPKWITNLEVIDDFEQGYWVKRGWDAVAQVRATAVVDVVASESLIEMDDQTLVPIGGIAYAGARGISKVEVKIDDGEWVEAQLREPLSDLTWVIWRYDWPFEEGEHTFAVRCYEGDGTLQITEDNSVLPSGATGIHEVTQDL